MSTFSSSPSLAEVEIANRSFRDGQLQICDHLGAGANGAVYTAMYSSDGERPALVAVKAMHTADAGSRTANHQAAELKLHSLVSDGDNVVSLHAFFEEDVYTIMVMDLHEGGDLETVTSAEVFVGKDDLMRSALTQVLDGISFCHSRGVFHRDIKPENVLCSKDLTRFLLADFGLATSDSTSLDLCGTDAYMSPELLDEFSTGVPYSTALNDIWAFGIVFLNTTTGYSVWEAALTREAEYQQFLYDEDFLRGEPCYFTDEALDLLKSILKVDPKDRPSIPQIRACLQSIDKFVSIPDSASESDATPDEPTSPSIPPAEGIELDSDSGHESSGLSSSSLSSLGPSSMTSSISSSSTGSMAFLPDAHSVTPFLKAVIPCNRPIVREALNLGASSLSFTSSAGRWADLQVPPRALTR